MGRIVTILFKYPDLVVFVMCVLVSGVRMTFYIPTKRYTVPGNQGTYDKLNQIVIIFILIKFIFFVTEKMRN